MVDNEVIDYGMIIGRVNPDNIELPSNYSQKNAGVIRVLEIIEHGTKWRNQYSSDSKRVISKVTNDVPFSLVNASKIKVHVEQALNAEFLLDNLEVTFTNFDPVKQSTLSKIISDLTSNDTVRGIETTERMLRNGTELTAFGKIEKLPQITSSSWLSSSSDTPQYRLSEPSIKGNYQFILTPISRTALIDKITFENKALKICLIALSSLGIAVGTYCAYKLIKDYLDHRKRENQIAQARLQRLKNQRARAQRYDDESFIESQQNLNRNDNLAQRNAVTEEREQNSCVICLINPRELVLLDCGHVCLCMECFERMPNSNCPICRQRFRTFLPCYIP